MTGIKFDELEIFYEKLAESIDRVGENNESLFLARLAMTMANEMSDCKKTLKCIEVAIEDYN